MVCSFSAPKTSPVMKVRNDTMRPSRTSAHLEWVPGRRNRPSLAAGQRERAEDLRFLAAHHVRHAVVLGREPGHERNRESGPCRSVPAPARCRPRRPDTAHTAPPSSPAAMPTMPERIDRQLPMRGDPSADHGVEPRHRTRRPRLCRMPGPSVMRVEHDAVRADQIGAARCGAPVEADEMRLAHISPVMPREAGHRVHTRLSRERCLLGRPRARAMTNEGPTSPAAWRGGSVRRPADCPATDGADSARASRCAPPHRSRARSPAGRA